MTQVTDNLVRAILNSMQIGVEMEQPALARAIERLALAGELAGISVEEMIDMLKAGVSVGALLDLIDRNLEDVPEDIGQSRRAM